MENIYYDALMPKVIKKDGRQELWNNSKIENAVYKAAIASGLDAEKATDLSEDVTESVEEFYGCRLVPELTYSDLHDQVELHIMKFNGWVAKNYIVYRKTHKDIHDGNNLLMKAVQEISREISKDNANIHNSPASKLYEIGSAANKDFVLDYLLPVAFKNAHLRGAIHIHDMNYYQLTYNCVVVPLERMLETGFYMPHGFIRAPKPGKFRGFLSACALTAVAIQSTQNDQYGGVAVDHIDTALKKFAKGLTDEEIYQGCESLIYNLCSLHSRAGNQVPFSSLSGGVDTDYDAVRVWHCMLEAYEAGLGKGEQAIFPNLMTKVKSGINLEPGTPNHELLLHSLHVSSKRLNPTYINCDASYNKDYGVEASYMGCRTRVLANVNGPEVTQGRGNITFTSINLVKPALESESVEEYFKRLDEVLQLVEQQLIHRWNILKELKKSDVPFNMDGIYIGSENLKNGDTIESVLKNGSLAFGFIGLAEALIKLTGMHHGQSEVAQTIGLKIVGRIREFANTCTRKYGLNFSLIATPAEGLSGRFTKIDKETYGEIAGVTDHEFYTNSHHIPVWYKIDAAKKFKLEGAYHAYCNGGHITYSEFDEAPVTNVEGLYTLMCEAFKHDVGYLGFNYPLDVCGDCGYLGVIKDDECTICASTNLKRVRRVSGYLSTVDKIGPGKRDEVEARVSHYEQEVTNND